MELDFWLSVLNISTSHAIPIASIANSEMGAGLHDVDWSRVSRDLDAQGSAVIEHLLSPEECIDLAALYPKDDLFRSRVVMSRHGFGRGEYKYFKYPLPELIAELRTAVYPYLVEIANRWNEAMGINVRF